MEEEEPCIDLCVQEEECIIDFSVSYDNIDDNDNANINDNENDSVDESLENCSMSDFLVIDDISNNEASSTEEITTGPTEVIEIMPDETVVEEKSIKRDNTELDEIMLDEKLIKIDNTELDSVNAFSVNQSFDVLQQKTESVADDQIIKTDKSRGNVKIAGSQKKKSDVSPKKSQTNSVVSNDSDGTTVTVNPSNTFIKKEILKILNLAIIVYYRHLRSYIAGPRKFICNMAEKHCSMKVSERISKSVVTPFICRVFVDDVIQVGYGACKKRRASINCAYLDFRRKLVDTEMFIMTDGLGHYFLTSPNSPSSEVRPTCETLSVFRRIVYDQDTIKQQYNQDRSEADAHRIKKNLTNCSQVGISKVSREELLYRANEERYDRNDPNFRYGVTSGQGHCSIAALQDQANLDSHSYNLSNTDEILNGGVIRENLAMSGVPKKKRKNKKNKKKVNSLSQVGIPTDQSSQHLKAICNESDNSMARNDSITTEISQHPLYVYLNTSERKTISKYVHSKEGPEIHRIRNGKCTLEEMKEIVSQLALLYKKILGNSDELTYGRYSEFVIEKCLLRAASILQVSVKVVIVANSDQCVRSKTYTMMINGVLEVGRAVISGGDLLDRRLFQELSDKLLDPSVTVVMLEENKYRLVTNPTFNNATECRFLGAFALQQCQINEAWWGNKTVDTCQTLLKLRKRSRKAGRKDNQESNPDRPEPGVPKVFTRSEAKSVKELLKCFVVYMKEEESDCVAILSRSAEFCRMPIKYQTTYLQDGLGTCTIWLDGHKVVEVTDEDNGVAKYKAAEAVLDVLMKTSPVVVVKSKMACHKYHLLNPTSIMSIKELGDKGVGTEKSLSIGSMLLQELNGTDSNPLVDKSIAQLIGQRFLSDSCDFVELYQSIRKLVVSRCLEWECEDLVFGPLSQYKVFQRHELEGALRDLGIEAFEYRMCDNVGDSCIVVPCIRSPQQLVAFLRKCGGSNDAYMLIEPQENLNVYNQPSKPNVSKAVKKSKRNPTRFVLSPRKPGNYQGPVSSNIKVPKPPVAPYNLPPAIVVQNTSRALMNRTWNGLPSDSARSNNSSSLSPNSGLTVLSEIGIQSQPVRWARTSSLSPVNRTNAVTENNTMDVMNKRLQNLAGYPADPESPTGLNTLRSYSDFDNGPVASYRPTYSDFDNFQLPSRMVSPPQQVTLVEEATYVTSIQACYKNIEENCRGVSDPTRGVKRPCYENSPSRSYNDYSDVKRLCSGSQLQGNSSSFDSMSDNDGILEAVFRNYDASYRYRQDMMRDYNNGLSEFSEPKNWGASSNDVRTDDNAEMYYKQPSSESYQYYGQEISPQYYNSLIN